MSRYNCKRVVLKCPKDFIPYNLSDGFKNEIIVDACVADEILSLWSKGIRTMGCCCGHGRKLGFIEVVDDDISKMKKLGYQNYIYEDMFGGMNRKDAFIPKSTHHEYNGYEED